MPTALERQIAQARSHQERALLRAHGAHDALLSEWPADGARDITLLGGRVLRVLERPSLVRNPQDDVVGVEVDVELYRRNGQQLLIDGHRRIINVPLLDGDEFAPAKAFLSAVIDSIKTAPAPEMFGRRGTVDTIFGDAADGYMQSSSGTYSTARAMTSPSVDTTSLVPFLGQDLTIQSICYEYFVFFDTSPVGTDSVSAAVLSLFGAADSSTTDFTIQARLHDWGATLAAGDEVAGASLSGKTLLATFNTSGFSASGYNDFTADANFVTNINGSGATRMIVVSDRQVSGTAPSGHEYVQVRSADNTGTTQDPKLVVTHAPVTARPATAFVRQAVQRAAVR